MSLSMYPFDPSGTNPVNLVGAVTPEVHTVVANTDNPNINYIIPVAAPFFGSSMQVYQGSGPGKVLLTQGVDYMLIFYFNSATWNLGLPVYGGIGIINQAFAGTISLIYQTLGGDWTVDDVGIVQALVDAVYNPRAVYWDQIASLPYAFPPGPHTQNIDSFKVWDDMITEVTALVTAVQSWNSDPAGLQAALTAHIASGTAHSAAAVGLGSTPNYPPATLLQAQQGLVNNALMTPYLTAQYLNSQPATAGRLIDIRVYNAAGTYTWTRPSNMSATGFIIVEGIGGGGGGANGGNPGLGNMALGGGGACGAYGKYMVTTPYVGATATVVVGAGGAVAAGGNNGNSGTDTIVTFPSTQALTFGHGSGGVYYTNTNDYLPANSLFTFSTGDSTTGALASTVTGSVLLAGYPSGSAATGTSATVEAIGAAFKYSLGLGEATPWPGYGRGNIARNPGASIYIATDSTPFILPTLADVNGPGSGGDGASAGSTASAAASASGNDGQVIIYTYA